MIIIESKPTFYLLQEDLSETENAEVITVNDISSGSPKNILDSESGSQCTEGSCVRGKKRKTIEDERAEEAYSILKAAANKDEFSTFGEYVGNELMMIKSKRSLTIAKNNINNMLFEAAIGNYDFPFSKSNTESCVSGSSVHSPLESNQSTDNNDPRNDCSTENENIGDGSDFLNLFLNK